MLSSFMFEEFKELVSKAWPLGLSAALGAVGVHLWGRFQKRMIVLRWHDWHQQLAFSTPHSELGKIAVTFNSRPITNVTACVVSIHNDSVTDLQDVEIDFSFADGTSFLNERANIRGSNRSFEYNLAFNSRVNELLSIDLTAEPNHPTLKYLLANRGFKIPVLNRDSWADFVFLVEPANLKKPNIQLFCNHIGARLIYQRPQQTLWGEPLRRAALAGLISSVILLSVVLQYIENKWLSAFIAFVFSACAATAGAYVIKMLKKLSKLLS